jgi:hypothetical protein
MTSFSRQRYRTSAELRAKINWNPYEPASRLLQVSGMKLKRPRVLIGAAKNKYLHTKDLAFHQNPNTTTSAA